MRSLRAIPFHLVSLGLHGLIVAIFFLFSKTMLSSNSDVVKPSKNIRVVGKAIRVDVVSMPKFTLQELKQVVEAKGDGQDVVEKKAKEIKGGDENTVFKKEVKKKSLADILKGLSKRNTKKSKRVKKVSKVGKKGEKSTLVNDSRFDKILSMGNKLSKGTALYGGSGSNAGDLFDEYALSVMEAVRKNWRLPGYLAGKNYKCKIRIFIGQTGKILKFTVLESSGNKDYDERALSSVRKVGLLPKPDKTIATRVAAGEIALAFPL